MNLPHSIQTVGIYGVGLLGGSIGMALKERCPDTNVVGIGRSKEKLQKAKALKAIDTYTCDPDEIPNSLDLLIVCTPVSGLHNHLKRALPSLKEGAVITDVGSTKATVVEQCESLVGNQYRFVGSHPMAGSHKTGVDAASADLFVKKVCVVTQTILTDADALNLISNFWVTVGMRVVRMSPEMHDRLVARSSHLPHVIAVALCHAVQNAGSSVLPVLGDGFKDTTRIAAGDPDMWADICMENNKELLEALSDFEVVIRDLKQMISGSNRDAIFAFLQDIHNWKNRFSS